MGRWDWAFLGSAVVLLVCLGAAYVCNRTRCGPGVAEQIRILDHACEAYRIEYGAYPPGRSDLSSTVLYSHLGSPRMTLRRGVEERRPAILEFPQDWLGLVRGRTSAPIVDVWGRPIRYANPGRHKISGVDLWSAGQNGIDEDASGSDDIANWEKE